jgi:O-antigen ligase
MGSNFKLDTAYQYLLILLAFFLPWTVFGANLIVVLICLLWLLSGDYLFKLKKIKNSNLMLASLFFFFLHLLGLIWTENMDWGFHILHKMWYFLLLFPILFTIVRQDYIKKYIGAFVLAVTLSELISYFIWFEIIEPFKNATISNPTPFVSHISYNPILAFAIYLVCYEIFFSKSLTKFQLLMYSFFAFSMTINMFITGGRAGQVMFFAMVIILIFQIFHNRKFFSIFLILILLPTIFFLAYNFSDLFQMRVDVAISNIVDYSSNKNTSVGQRITYFLYSFEIIQNNLFFGVGTGDFPDEINKINELNGSVVNDTTNPHNMYLLVMTQLGLIGLLSFLSIFYFQIKHALSTNNFLSKKIGFALPILFLVIMLSDSYLLGHFTTLLFVFFSSFLHNNFEKFE